MHFQNVEDMTLVLDLWNRSQYKVTVDGGTSVWHNIINNIDKKVSRPVPDLITGDLDSANLENVDYFKNLGARVVTTPDQDHTDFTKALLELGNIRKTGDCRLDNAEAILAFVETGGRMDHVMGNIQTLSLASNLVPNLPPLYLCSSHSVSWLLQPGKHTIPLPSMRPDHCGIIPLDGEALLTTTGLKWNLTNEMLRFGHLVSTSNTFDSESNEVAIETNSLLLWTMDLPRTT